MQRRLDLFLGLRFLQVVVFVMVFNFSRGLGFLFAVDLWLRTWECSHICKFSMCFRFGVLKFGFLISRLSICFCIGVVESHPPQIKSQDPQINCKAFLS